MTPTEFARVRELFDEAVILPLGDQQAFVEANSPPGSALRQELLRILAVHHDTGAAATTVTTTGPMAPDATCPDDPQVGNYRILRELGGGGMGIVYLAVRSDDVFHKTVAVKVIRPGVANREYLERFRRERQILAGLDHANIARILDGGDTRDGRPFYVMEYVPGLPLDEHCRRFGADVETRLRLMLQVCDAVEYLHDNAIVHRDLKPGNILVTTDGRAKVLDLGIAGVQTPEGLVGSPGDVGGRTRLLTPGFASPEQIEGSPASKCSDIYTLGVVLYHLLTGRLPFVNDTGEPDLARQLSEDDPAVPSAVARDTLRSGIGPDLDRVVLNALRRDPSRRYASAGALRDDLERVLDGRAVTAHAPTWTYRAGKIVRRNKLPTALAAGLVIALAAASWFAIQGRIKHASEAALESAFEKTLQSLRQDVERWADPNEHVPMAQKTAVVEKAAGLLKDEGFKKTAASGQRRQLVNKVVTGVEGILSRAHELAGGAVPVQKDVAIAFRIVGDFRLVVAQTSGGRRDDAVRSYEHAAAAARDVSRADEAWARAVLNELAARLGSIGVRLDPRTYLPPEQVADAASAVPPPVAAVRKPQPPLVHRDLEPVDEALRKQLQERLAATRILVQRKRDQVAAQAARLQAEGRTIRGDAEVRLSNVEQLLEQADDDLTSGNLEKVEQRLSSASYILGQIR